MRVLLQSGRTSYKLRGASDVNGSPLDPAKTYTVTSGGTGVVIQASGAHSAQTAAPPLRVSAPSGGAVTLEGPASNGISGGSYRGAIEFRPTGVFGLSAINAVSLESYVAGVISAEVPASWPGEALRAQAIAARTYAITTNAGGAQGFTQYADTRSQMYRGVPRGDRQHERRGARHRRAGRHLRRESGHDLLLLQLRRAHRERRELVRRQRPEAVAQERAGPVRHGRRRTTAGRPCA